MIIYKQRLQITGVQFIELPRYADILHAGEQGGDLCIWYKCDPSEPTRKREIHIYGTGHEMTSEVEYKHISTVVMSQGFLVWHVFEVLGD